MATSSDALSAGAAAQAAGTVELAAGLSTLTGGVDDAASGSDTLATSASRLQREGTQQVRREVVASSREPARARSYLSATDARAAAALPYGAPEGAVGHAGYVMTLTPPPLRDSGGAAGVALGATLLVALAVLAAMRVRRVRAQRAAGWRSCASPVRGCLAQRVPGMHRLRRPARLAAVAVVPVVLVVGLGGCCASTSSPSTSSTSSSPATTASALPDGAALVASTGGQPCGVLATASAVWVSLADTGTLLRLDPKTGATLGSTALDRTPCEILSAAGSLWVVTQSGVVDRVDPATGAVVARIEVGGERPTRRRGRRQVWVSNRGSGALSRIDPATGPGGGRSGCRSRTRAASWRWVGAPCGSATTEAARPTSSCSTPPPGDRRVPVGPGPPARDLGRGSGVVLSSRNAPRSHASTPHPVRAGRPARPVPAPSTSLPAPTAARCGYRTTPATWSPASTPAPAR